MNLIKVLFFLLIQCATVSGQVDEGIIKDLNLNIKAHEMKEFLNAGDIRTDILIDRFRGFSANCNLEYEIEKFDGKYPNLDYELVAIKKIGERCGNTRKVTQVYDAPDFGKRFLIAIKKDSAGKMSVKYVSGKLFLDNVSDDFSLNMKDPNSYREYIEMRLHYLKVSKIEFQRRRRGNLIYKVYSEVGRSSLLVTVDTKSYDNEIQIVNWL